MSIYIDKQRRWEDDIRPGFRPFAILVAVKLPQGHLVFSLSGTEDR